MTKQAKQLRNFYGFLQERLRDPQLAIAYLNESLADEGIIVFPRTLKVVIDARTRRYDWIGALY